MNIYKIVTKPEWNPEPTYHAGHTIKDVLAGTNSEFHAAITNIEEVTSGLGIREVMEHELPMTVTL